jgi:hypothetical protein
VFAGKTNIFDTTNPSTSFSGSLADTVTNLGNYALNVYASNTATISAIAVEYAYLDTSGENIISGSANPTEVVLTTNVSDGTTVLLSPLMLKYMW